MPKMYNVARDSLPVAVNAITAYSAPTRVYMVWAVYATVGGTVNVRVGEYPYKDKNLAEIHALGEKHGSVRPEKVTK
jgi:hypothetical protein